MVYYITTKVEGPYEVHDFTVADGTTISGGVLCSFVDPRTAKENTNTDVQPLAFAGIAATEKVASNGKTELGLFTTGTFKMQAGAAVAAGDLVMMSGGEVIPAVASAILSGAVVGKALETMAANSTGEVKLI